MNPTQLLTVASYYGAFAAPPAAPPTTPKVALIEAPADPNAPVGPRPTFDVTPMEQLQQARPADAEKLWAGPVDAQRGTDPPADTGAEIPAETIAMPPRLDIRA